MRIIDEVDTTVDQVTYRAYYVVTIRTRETSPGYRFGGGLWVAEKSEDSDETLLISKPGLQYLAELQAADENTRAGDLKEFGYAKTYERTLLFFQRVSYDEYINARRTLHEAEALQVKTDIGVYTKSLADHYSESQPVVRPRAVWHKRLWTHLFG